MLVGSCTYNIGLWPTGEDYYNFHLQRDVSLLLPRNVSAKLVKLATSGIRSDGPLLGNFTVISTHYNISERLQMITLSLNVSMAQQGIRFYGSTTRACRISDGTNNVIFGSRSVIHQYTSRFLMIQLATAVTIKSPKSVDVYAFNLSTGHCYTTRSDHASLFEGRLTFLAFLSTICHAFGVCLNV